MSTNNNNNNELNESAVNYEVRTNCNLLLDTNDTQSLAENTFTAELKAAERSKR